MESKNYNLALEKFRSLISKPETKQGMKSIIENRDKVLARYTPVFSPENIPDLSEEDFRSCLYFENNRHW